MFEFKYINVLYLNDAIHPNTDLYWINDLNSFKTHENILVDDIIWLMIEHVSFIMSMFMSTTISMYTVLMQQHDIIFVWSAYCSKLKICLRDEKKGHHFPTA